MRLERQTSVAVSENVNTDRHLDTKLKPLDPIGPVVRHLLSVMESLILQYVSFRLRADQISTTIGIADAELCMCVQLPYLCNFI